MNLDLSKLSPVLRSKLCQSVDHLCYQEYHRMKGEMESYPPGPVLDEMKAWQAAAMDVAIEARTLPRYK